MFSGESAEGHSDVREVATSCFRRARSGSLPLPGLSPHPAPQARVPGMDDDAASGHVPAVLRPREHARVRRLHEPGLRLGQEGGRRRAQQLLLGLLPDPGRRRPPGGPVTPAPSPAGAARGGGAGCAQGINVGRGPARERLDLGDLGPTWGAAAHGSPRVLGALLRALGLVGTEGPGWALRCHRGPCRRGPLRDGWHRAPPRSPARRLRSPPVTLLLSPLQGRG